MNIFKKLMMVGTLGCATLTTNMWGAEAPVEQNPAQAASAPRAVERANQILSFAERQQMIHDLDEIETDPAVRRELETFLNDGREMPRRSVVLMRKAVRIIEAIQAVAGMDWRMKAAVMLQLALALEDPRALFPVSFCQAYWG